MTDQRESEIPPEEHDEFHSSLEVDDSSGWRVLVVPILLIVLVIGMIAFFFIYQGDTEPDPRVAEQLRRKAEAAERSQSTPAPAVPATNEVAPEGEGVPAPEPAG